MALIGKDYSHDPWSKMIPFGCLSMQAPLFHISTTSRVPRELGRLAHPRWLDPKQTSSIHRVRIQQAKPGIHRFQARELFRGDLQVGVRIGHGKWSGGRCSCLASLLRCDRGHNGNRWLRSRAPSRFRCHDTHYGTISKALCIEPMIYT